MSEKWEEYERRKQEAAERLRDNPQEYEQEIRRIVKELRL